jgi:hypoxanthine-DNA glycosylase
MSEPSAGSGAPVPGFPPVEGETARVLVLGTLPSVRSLQLGQYYGHPRNAFWDVVAELGVPRTLDYDERCRGLTQLGIALWDVLASAERPGSLDAAIRAPSANDFAGFYARHPELEAIALNGKKAEELFRKHAHAPDGVTLVALPSTSPANTARNKVEAWLEMLQPRLA